MDAGDGGHTVVVDAGGSDLLRVDDDGTVTVLAMLPAGEPSEQGSGQYVPTSGAAAVPVRRSPLSGPSTAHGAPEGRTWGPWGHGGAG